MWFTKQKRNYSRLTPIDPDYPITSTAVKRSRVSYYLFGVIVVIFLITALLHRVSKYAESLSIQSPPKCTNPSIRREWRSLSNKGKHRYIDAVNCLATMPSILQDNSTLYDDFPWTHFWIGAMSHYEPSFFPWHRQFIHIYEQTLRSKCGYTGSIPFGTYSNAFENFTDVDNRYWDWTLDWEDLTSSPIWDSELGFGGNGDIKHSDDSGGCLTNGPFTNLRPLFYNDSRRQHCLSRSFQEHDVRKIRPASVDAILNLNEFDGFSVLMEKEIHNIIPQTVRGDFLLLTAPNDPVFYLHHTQMDRLWWIWQQQDLPRRLTTYSSQASIQDELLMGGIGSDTVVKDVMNTEGNSFCYRYQYL